MRKFIINFNRYWERRKTADEVFRLTRDYNSKWQRWVCRYHLYLHKDDYSTRDLLSHPKSRTEYIKLLEHLHTEMQEVFFSSFFDSRDHYDGCRYYLKSLRSFTLHYPLLWFVRFRLRF